jgi:hypothetical protein
VRLLFVPRLRRAGYHALVVCSTSGSAAYTAPAQYGQYRDMAGNTALFPAKSIIVGTAPVLLETGRVRH